MTNTLIFINDSEEGIDPADHDVTYERKKPAMPGQIQSRKLFAVKRVRTITVYALLIVSIFVSLATAIATFPGVTEEAGSQLKPAIADEAFTADRNFKQSGSVRFFIFVLVALTCSIALATIIRREKINARLISKLRSTNKQLNEEVLMRTRHLTKALQTKDHFMGIAVHELKAPVNGIEGLVNLITLEKSTLSATQAEYLGHIQYACKKMERLINDILELNRIEQGKAIMKWQRVNVMHLLRQLQPGFAAQAVKKNIDLQIEPIDAAIETDADSLSRILENLLSNAIKFSPNGKSVSLRVSSKHDQIVFEVSDEGPGIPKEEQPRLFNKFQRLSNRPTNAETSTGLGLSIVKELTTQLGGEITFWSEIGKGSSFIVTLPQFHRTTHPLRLQTRKPPDAARQKAIGVSNH